ncbi:uncharacterized protein LOC120358342 [Solenopsis invicta]|uniref:uncharacterized protein LOC120358342 n=1 Tax=Solenopsis invicta TaxID=13686 RepID=UPI00193CDE99|nr:uncharacterized protein LOC120358342 [Solenopsis invicta]
MLRRYLSIEQSASRKALETDCECFKMRNKVLYTLFFLIVFAVIHQSIETKKVVIHVPYRVKNVKHTHTIYKIIAHRGHGKHKSDDEYYDDY